MKSRFSKFLCAAMLTSVVPQVWAIPDPSPDPNASVVYLRTSCDIGYSAPELTPVENCFEEMGALQTWIEGRPDPAAALLIEIGPGVFTSGNSGTGFNCIGNSKQGGNLTFRGAGPDATLLSGAAFGVKLKDCIDTKWTFEDMTIKGLYSVAWYGGGESIWNNVVFNGAWFDRLDDTSNPCPSGQQGVHRFFSSRVVAWDMHSPAYNSLCGDGWFWGSEIIYAPQIHTGNRPPALAAISILGDGNVLHLYGSNVQAIALENDLAPRTMAAIQAKNGAEVHSHGVGLDLIGNPGWTLVGLDASNGAEIHANESSYFVQPSTGVSFNRIVNVGGHVHAPYLWEHVPTQSFSSVDGADMTTVQGTSTSDGHPHMVIYSATCKATDASKPWWDSAEGVCR